MLDPDFVNGAKCIIFWHNNGLKVYFDLYVADFLLSKFGKSAAYKSKYTLIPLLSQNMIHFTPITKSGSKL